MFHKKTKTPTFKYDPALHRPILKCSICNGEQVAGFKEISTGKFHEIMFIQSEKDLVGFMKTYGLDKVDREY